MLIGELIAYTAMLEDKSVTWLPSYGPEMRGGTANCSIIVSEYPIASPVISEATAIIAMNGPSLEKFETQVMSGGMCFINSSLVSIKPKRNDIKIINVDCNRIALELGHDKCANMVMLGAVIYELGIVSTRSLEEAMRLMFKNKKAALISANMQAISAWKSEYKKVV